MILGTALCFHIASANMGIAEQNDTDTEDLKPIDICTQNLITIGQAIQLYKNDHNGYPEWLSDLHPQYLPDENILLCPSDENKGKAFFSFNQDQNMPISYDYQFHPEYRQIKSDQLVVYGEVIPLVRCRNHRNEDYDCLNLSFSYEVFHSSGIWESTPEDLYSTPEKAIEELEAGLKRQPYKEGISESVYVSLIQLYVEAGRMEDAKGLIRRFNLTVKTDDLQAHYLLCKMLEMTDQLDEALVVFENLAERHPDERNVFRNLARVHKKLGNSELAEEYNRKADPMYELWGKVVSDFSTTDLDGNPISLRDYRGKVVLLDFWGTWCGFCIQELPNLKRVYDIYKEQGFDIIGVSLDDPEEELQKYIEDHGIQWRQISSGESWRDDPLARQYDITGVPSQWLIDRDGKLISHKARGAELEPLVVKTLKC